MTKIDYNQYSTEDLYSLLKLHYMREFNNGTTVLDYNDWIDELNARISVPTIEEYLYEG